MPSLIPASLGVAVYLPDHRGTGLSSLLECSSGRVDEKCLEEWKDRSAVLKQFTITNAARDLKAQIQAVKREYSSARVSLYAVSYGTQWADRLLSILMEDKDLMIDSVVLDGVVNPEVTSVSRYDIWANRALIDTLQYCDLDSTCLSHFSEQSVVESVRSLLKEINSGKQYCVNTYFPFITTPIVQDVLFQMIQSANTYYLRSLIPALIFRMNRCSSLDVPVLQHFFQNSPLLLANSDAFSLVKADSAEPEELTTRHPKLLTGEENNKVVLSNHHDHDHEESDLPVLASLPEPTRPLPPALYRRYSRPLPMLRSKSDEISIPSRYIYSPLLNFNIVESERWLAPNESEPSLSALNSWKAHSLASPHDTLDYFKLRADWPVYPLDPYFGKVSEYPNVLMLNGELDPSTPSFQASTLAGVTANTRKYISIPLAGHVTTLVAEAGFSCPLDIVLTYLLDGTVNSTCVSSMPTLIDFGGSSNEVKSVSLTYFGTEDLWN